VVLNEIGLVSFKAYDSAELGTAPFTVLIGPNNGGKSTVLQALALLAQTVGSNAPGRIKTDGPIVDLGESVAELANDTKTSTSANWEISLTWRVPAQWQVIGAAPDVEVGFRLVVRPLAFPSIFDTHVSIGREIPSGRPIQAKIAWISSAAQQQLEIAGSEATRGDFHFPPVHRVVRMNTSQPWLWQLGEGLAEVPDGLPATSEPDLLAVVMARETVPFLSGRIAEQLQAFRYVGADRQVVRSAYPLGQAYTSPQTAAEVVNELAFSDDLLRRVDERLQGPFEFGLDKRLFRRSDRPGSAEALVALVGSKGSRRRNLVNMGAGFAQFAWIALQLELARVARIQYPAVPRPTPVVGVEEPELHLHPKLQPAMARLLADFVRTGNQVLCTTQSEHFLLAVLELVLDGTLQPDELMVHYLDAPHGDVERLDVDRKGQLKGGLKGFFEENERQMERQIELLRKSAGLDS